MRGGWGRSGGREEGWRGERVREEEREWERVVWFRRRERKGRRRGVFLFRLYVFVLFLGTLSKCVCMCTSHHHAHPE